MANISLNVTDGSGKTTSSVEAPEDLFGISSEDIQNHIPLVHQVVVAQLAAARQGTHSVKTRSTVSGGGRKPWKQKGTGRARQGSIRSPQWAGGAIVHGPVPRDYAQRTPKKMKAAALRYMLSDRANAGRVHIVDFGISDAPSTKTANAVLLQVVEQRFTTVVLARENVNEWLSVRNLPTVHVLFADQLNTYDVVTAQDLVFSKDGFDAFIAAKTGSETALAKEA
ncbi:50S ribosomal protein L4 [Bifidobacterium aquikefiri]|uniref:Large ribosomal subunit protein uL4 n=1 Tax=Bifidobacterium aquikefiri TaxID=1653207 RepID=A0A261G320_9BIFI|nr:50S ribosomal protein L4 [Bifidobacterium aquikefiri]OZG65800.1 50S ribosomal protein L4 [Bifidobacterium aquikefiri]